MKGIVGCLDPILYDWLSYAPTHSDSTLLERSIGVVDSVLSQTALPLKDHNSAGGYDRVYTGPWSITCNYGDRFLSFLAHPALAVVILYCEKMVIENRISGVCRQLGVVSSTVFDLISEHTLISGHPPFCAGGDYCQST